MSIFNKNKNLENNENENKNIKPKRNFFKALLVALGLSAGVATLTTGCGEEKQKQAIEQEKEKLKHYVVVPRPQQENAEDEYEHQRKRMEAMIDLPYTMEMDLMIAKSMLANGYDKQDVEQVLNSRGEQSAEEENYGEKLIHLITTITKEEEYALTATQEKVLVRSFENEMTETADS